MIQILIVILKGIHREVGGSAFQVGGTDTQGAIDRLEEGRTMICVAHRLSTLRGMDKIIVLEAGRVEEKGTYNELLERNGAFAAMARKQGITSDA